jgi:hypothetical protein
MAHQRPMTNTVAYLTGFTDAVMHCTLLPDR